jgi:tetratricopeptide (TPR) repeat protein
MKMKSPLLASLTAALLLIALVRPAAADGAVDEARIRFQRGVQLFHEGSNEAALAEFRKAYQIAPSYRLLYNIGQVHYELHDYVGALKSFKQYLADGGAEVPPDRRAQVETELRKLDGLIAYLEVTAVPDGSDILIDDVPVGISPLDGPVLVNAGQRRVTASKAGRLAPVRNLTVAGGERVRLTLQVPEAPLVHAVPFSGGRPARYQPGQQVGVWLGVAATSMFALGAAGFAFATQQAKHNFDTELATYPTSKERVDFFRSRMTTLAAVTDGLAAAALVTGGLTVYLALRARAEDPERRRGPARGVAVKLTVGGITVDGGF